MTNPVQQPPVCECGHAKEHHDRTPRLGCTALVDTAEYCPCTDYRPVQPDSPPPAPVPPNRVLYLEAALRELSQPRGRYSRDPLTHARNVIEDMADLASAALAGTWELGQ